VGSAGKRLQPYGQYTVLPDPARTGDHFMIFTDVTSDIARLMHLRGLLRPQSVVAWIIALRAKRWTSMAWITAVGL
jgi:hypothetical protein